jgi:hypothetical protein
MRFWRICRILNVEGEGGPVEEIPDETAHLGLPVTSRRLHSRRRSAGGS